MRKLHLNNRVSTPLCIALLAVFLVSPQLYGQSAQPIAEMPVFAIENYPAFVEAIDRVELRAQVSGYLDSIEFTEGALVKRGDLLFRIDPRVYRNRLADAEAALAAASAEADYAKREAARAVRLFARDAISEEEVERLKSLAQVADSRLLTARATIQAATLDLQFAEIRAPFDGRIGRASVTPGNLVQSKDVLAVIVGLDQLYVRVDIAEQDFAQLSDIPHDHWLVHVENDQAFNTPFSGRIALVDNEVRRGTGTVRVYAKIDNARHALLPGMFVRASLAIDSNLSTLSATD